MKRFTITAAFCAALALFCCVGCSNDSQADSQIAANSSAADSQADSQSDSQADTDENTDDSSAAEATNAGEHILQAYDFFQSESYSLKMRYTAEDGSITEIYRVVNGDSYFEQQQNAVGKNGSIRIDGQSYDYDMVCGIYRLTDAERLDSMIENVVEQNLPATTAHIDDELAALYAVEEYTYTGDTYICVLDFYFDKETGEIVKYTTTYSIEGEDDIIETREFYELIPSAAAESEASQEADFSAMDADFISQLADFEGMTEERRLGYCQAIFVTAGVTADDLTEAGIDDNALKTISYDDFTALVYEYAFKHLNQS